MYKTLNQRQIAILTGVSIAIMAVVAAVIMGTIFSQVFSMNTSDLEAQWGQLKFPISLGIIGWCVILICDLIVSWGLYKFYAPKNSRNSMAMGLLRLIYSFILLLAIIQLVRSVIEPKNTSEIYYLIQSFQSIWQFGLIIFGFHLLLLSKLVCEKRTMERILGILIFIAGIGYSASNIADLFIVDYEAIRSQVEMVFILPMVLGEVGLGIWLIIKGGKEINSMNS